jgi:hypothetical protein
VIIESFYGRYDGFTVTSKSNVVDKYIKAEDQRQRLLDKLETDPSFNPLKIDKEQALLLQNDLWKTCDPCDITPIVGKALKWSRELAKQAFFLTFITKDRKPVLYGVLNQRPNAKVAVMMHLGELTLWFAPSFTADCTFVRAACLTLEDERERD